MHNTLNIILFLIFFSYFFDRKKSSTQYLKSISEENGNSLVLKNIGKKLDNIESIMHLKM